MSISVDNLRLEIQKPQISFAEIIKEKTSEFLIQAGSGIGLLTSYVFTVSKRTSTF